MPKGRVMTFTHSKVESLLETIRELKLCETSTWDAVARRHRAQYPEQNRTIDSLRKKFNNLSGLKVPSGAPHCPPEVQEAKHICLELTKYMDIEVAKTDFEDDNLDKNGLDVEKKDDDDGDNVNDRKQSTVDSINNGLINVPLEEVGVSSRFDEGGLNTTPVVPSGLSSTTASLASNSGKKRRK